MKIPLKWLADYVPLDGIPVAELAERLTLAGLEVSGARLVGLPPPEGLRVKADEAGPVWERDKVVTAQVTGIDKHPDADKLKLVHVTYGGPAPKTVVTGAPNVAVGDRGQKVVLGLEGFQYFDGHVSPKQLKRLKPGKIRGVTSDAMLCSSFELGIDEEHEGIIILEDDAPVGVPAADLFGDVVFEADVLPNMARCLALLGVAREVAALFGRQVKLPPHEPRASGEPVEGKVRVVIENASLSPRYAATLLRGVKVGPAPGWMQRRLTYAGMRPISNVVDVTNYVMLEWGQPLHAFDYDKLVSRAGGKAPTITVRPARPGETLKTLDNIDRKLTPDMLVIADTAGPVALAGVMGGAETEVSAATTNVLLESASFDFLSVRRTMKALNLPSEASLRFSKGVPPASVPAAAGRAAELLRQHAGATVCKGIVDVYPAPPAPLAIDLTMAEVRRVLGVGLPLAECARLLRTLEFQVEESGPDALRVVAPPHRLDIQEGPADLIEDLARLHGYDRLPATLLADELPPQAANEPLEFEEKLRDLLTELGLQEVVTYSLTTPEAERKAGTPEGPYVTLLNPISSERSVMRRGLLAGVLEGAERNLRHADAARLFEVGSVYLPQAGEKLPDEPRRLALVLAGRRQREFWGDAAKDAGALDFFDLKGLVEALAAALHLPDVSFRPPSAPPPALHPKRSAELLSGDAVLGSFGELHPRVAEALKLGGKTVLAGELDVEALRAAAPARFRAAPVPQFPAALRDVAVVIAEDVPAGRVEDEIRAAGAGLMAGLRLFDVYRGDSIPPGTKSLAYALTYQAPDRTLTDKEVDKAHKKIEDRLTHVLKAQVRGKA
jgi:phenylalanyl-tRNA synthetase beta chain